MARFEALLCSLKPSYALWRVLELCYALWSSVARFEVLHALLHSPMLPYAIRHPLRLYGALWRSIERLGPYYALLRSLRLCGDP